jgi:hypothetical protein
MTKKLFALLFLAAALLTSGNRVVNHGGGGGGGPTLSNATVTDSSGVCSLTLTFSASVSIGSGGNGGVTITPSGGAATCTYVSGSGSTSLVYALSRQLESSETFTTGYTPPGNGIEATSGGTDVASYSGSSGTNSSAFAYLVKENCEGGTTPSGWTDAGTSTWAYATPIEGTYSWSVADTVAGSSYYSFTAGSTFEVYVKVRFLHPVETGNVFYVFTLRNASDAALVGAKLNTNAGALAVNTGGSDSSLTVGVVTTGVTYHFWLRFSSGGTSSLAFSTDGIRPASGDNFTSKTGSTADNAARFKMSATAASPGLIIDHMRVSTSVIGNNPP